MIRTWTSRLCLSGLCTAGVCLAAAEPPREVLLDPKALERLTESVKGPAAAPPATAVSQATPVPDPLPPIHPRPEVGALVERSWESRDRLRMHAWNPPPERDVEVAAAPVIPVARPIAAAPVPVVAMPNPAPPAEMSRQLVAEAEPLTVPIAEDWAQALDAAGSLLGTGLPPTALPDLRRVIPRTASAERPAPPPAKPVPVVEEIWWNFEEIAEGQ